MLEYTSHPWKKDQEPYELRYVFGYAMDGTDLPCYILWPARTEDHSFWCLDAWKGDWVQLDKCGFIAAVGIEHFFDAFCFSPQRPWRASCHIEEDTHIKQLEDNKFMLTPRRIPVERRAPAAKSGADVVMDAGEESGSGAESGWSGVSDKRPRQWPLTRTGLTQHMRRSEICLRNCMTLTPRGYSRGVTSEDAPGVKLTDGQEKLRELVHLPRNWRLARLTIPLWRA